MKYNFDQTWSFCRNHGEESRITLPHDAMLYEKREKDNPSGSGGAFFEGGQYIYTKKFRCEKNWMEKSVFLQFEGIYPGAEIFLNGEKAGDVVNGYLTYQFLISPYLKYAEENFLEVRVDHTKLPDSRWYTGAGIYRSVWLLVENAAYIPEEQFKISTVSYDPSKIKIEAAATKGKVRLEIFDGETQILTEEMHGEIMELELPNAKLWSDESPFLYRCVASVLYDGELTDQKELLFGIRKIEWNAGGFFINGKETLLRGGCIHADNGVIGARSLREAEWRRIKILKDYGFNAIRCAHNPFPEEMLRACDFYGMYVIEEAWDQWYRHKSKYDYASAFPEHFQEDISAMVRKDFNHPSVIMYSIGNEVSEPASKEGLTLARQLMEQFHREDPSRPVTAGANLMILAQAAKGQQMYQEGGGMEERNRPDMTLLDSAKFNEMVQHAGTGMNHAADSDEADEAVSPYLDLLDIAGYNYASGRYPMEGKKHPNRLIYGSETFPQDLSKNWEMVKRYAYLIGDFMWTAWDYIGETGAGAWAYTEDAKAFAKPYPWLLGGAGALDLLGDPTGEAYHARAIWTHNKVPAISVQPVIYEQEKLIKSPWRGTNSIPSWSFQNCEGREATVEVYADADVVELFVNQKSIGVETITDCKAEFRVCYEPGALEAVTYDKTGKQLASSKLVSASGKHKIQIQQEEQYSGDRNIVYLNINICGENGIVESNADEELTVKVTGGELLGFGSANPRTEESFTRGIYTTFYGRAQAVVRVTGARAAVSAKGRSLKEQTLYFNHELS